MKKAYLFVYNDDVGTRDEVKKTLSEMPEITHWRYDMPNCFYVISEASAKQLAEHLRQLKPNGMFIFTEMAGNEYGWLTSESWYLIQKKAYKPTK